MDGPFSLLLRRGASATSTRASRKLTVTSVLVLGACASTGGVGGLWKVGKTNGVCECGEGEGEGPKSMLTYSEAGGGEMGADGLRERGTKLPRQEMGLFWVCNILEP